ncbi:flagellar basal body P-ring formation chaperone FlgA [Marinobacter fuscus]|nr:flagellar basal body P-ring formation chaperone FlgA [Marinobacter fuscus]
MRIIFLAVFLVFTGQPAISLAQTSAADIQRTAEHFLSDWSETMAANGYKTRFEVGSIDRRLALAACESAPSASFAGDPTNSTNPSLLIACSGERPWRMYVPARIEIHGPALVASRALARGERLTPQLVRTETVQINASRRGVITQAAQVSGMMVRRPVSAGTVLTPDLLEAPNAIERGDHVVITARSGSFSVSTRGKALASASVGEQVLVKNLRSERTVKARATRPGHVEIPM